MWRIPWLWNIDWRLKQVFVFFRPSEVINFRLKSLLETTFAQSKQICFFDDGDTHTGSIDLVGVESAHSAIKVKDSQMKAETPNASHATPHFFFFCVLNANENPSNETSRPLATSSLAVAAWRPKRVAPLAKRSSCSKSSLAVAASRPKKPAPLAKRSTCSKSTCELSWGFVVN